MPSCTRHQVATYRHGGGPSIPSCRGRSAPKWWRACFHCRAWVPRLGPLPSSKEAVGISGSEVSARHQAWCFKECARFGGPFVLFVYMLFLLGCVVFRGFLVRLATDMGFLGSTDAAVSLKPCSGVSDEFSGCEAELFAFLRMIGPTQILKPAWQGQGIQEGGKIYLKGFHLAARLFV